MSQLLPKPEWLITGALQPNGMVLVTATKDLSRWSLEAVYLDTAGGIVIPDGRTVHSSECWLEIETSAHIRGRVAFAAASDWATAMSDIADIMDRWDAADDANATRLNARRPSALTDGPRALEKGR